MGSEVWIGLIVGGLISFVASIAANYFYPSIVSLLSKRRIYISISKRKNEVLEYLFLLSIKDDYVRFNWFLLSRFLALLLSLLIAMIFAASLVVLIGISSISRMIDNLFGGSIAIFIGFLAMYRANKHATELELFRLVLFYPDSAREKLVKRWGVGVLNEVDSLAKSAEFEQFRRKMLAKW